jgi:hypothetical protein
VQKSCANSLQHTGFSVGGEAAIGAGLGGVGDGIYEGAAGGKQVKILSETKLDFQLGQPLTVNVMPRSVGATQ